MKRKIITTLLFLCLIAGICYYISLPDYHVRNSMSFSNQGTRDTELTVIVYKYWGIDNTIREIEPDGSIMTTDSFNRRLKKYCKESCVPYHSSHKIRFYNASTAFDGNNLTPLVI